ncbi:MAG TPA: hypothetical protein VHP83_06685 [Aggregatilineaceae bacterium]|nr:hypothetical protein [Aggregatilineaceae bacterium]
MNTSLKFARLAGVLYLIVVCGGIFAEMGFCGWLVIKGVRPARVESAVLKLQGEAAI